MLGIVGVGNTLAGDDGAGVEVVHLLKTIWEGEPKVFLHTLEGDHFEIVDLLDRAEKFVFVDAFAGGRPGELVFAAETRRSFAPSFHQTDITAVMQSLEALGIAEPFPAWEVWGVAVSPPSELREGLNPEVDRAVKRLCSKLCGLIEETIRAKV
jgi:hydrogenase maturation protease